MAVTAHGILRPLRIGGAWYGLDDAVTATVVLADLDAGRDEDAARFASMARLDALDRDGLEALCAAFGVEVYPAATLWDEWPGD